MDGTVLIADDDRGIRIVLTQALTRAGCRVHATGSLSQLMRWVADGAGDLVITDVMMPDGNGLDLIPAITRARPGLPVIVISAQNSIVTAIRATEAEVFDYLPKPFDLPELMARVRAGLERRAPRPTPAPALPDEGAPDSAALIGATPAMQALFREVAKVVATDLPIVIAAEPGAGRSTLARALHMLGERSSGPLVTLAPGDPLEALPQRLAEAQGGTLIVEDPAAHDPLVQQRLAVLLDAAATPAPNMRLVATTGPDPLADIAAGRLHAQLYYRLAGMVLSLPPLRERLDDLPALARLLLDRAAAGQGAGAGRELSAPALELLRAHRFPGNLRELDNLLRRLSLTAPAPVIEAAQVALALAAVGPVPAPRTDPAQPLSDTIEQHLQRYFDLHGDDLPPPGLYDRIMRECERPLIQIALDACNGNQLRCAELLGMNRNTLRKKIADLDIQVTRRRRVM